MQRSCRIVRLSRAAYYRPPTPRMERDAPVIAALNAAVERHPRIGFWKCVDRIRRDVFPWNPKRLYRVYKALRLNLPRRARRRLPARLRQSLEAPAVLNRTWALDFMADSLYGWRQFRVLNVIDEGNREALAIEIATSIPSLRVVRVLEELVELHGKPASIRVDNGPELTRHSSPGAGSERSRSATSSVGSPIRTPISNVSTEATARTCSTPMPSARWKK